VWSVGTATDKTSEENKSGATDRAGTTEITIDDRLGTILSEIGTGIGIGKGTATGIAIKIGIETNTAIGKEIGIGRGKRILERMAVEIEKGKIGIVVMFAIEISIEGGEQ
jgi:hypothetical protein